MWHFHFETLRPCGSKDCFQSLRRWKSGPGAWFGSKLWAARKTFVYLDSSASMFRTVVGHVDIPIYRQMSQMLLVTCLLLMHMFKIIYIERNKSAEQISIHRLHALTITTGISTQPWENNAWGCPAQWELSMSGTELGNTWPHGYMQPEFPCLFWWCFQFQSHGWSRGSS